MIFTCGLVERKDAAGVVQARGVNWCEARVGWEITLTTAANMALCFGVLAALWVLVGWLLNLGIAVGPTLLAVSLLSAAYSSVDSLRGMGGNDRALLFHRSGLIEAPFGMRYYHKSHRAVSGHMNDIVNIEVERIPVPHGEQPSDYPCGVRLIKRSGQITHVAWDLREDDAHELVVKLATQLGRMKGESAIDGGTGGTVEVVIG